MSNLMSNEIIVTGFTEKSILKSAGILEGDELISYNKSPITSIQQLGQLKDNVKSDYLEVSVLRDGETIRVTIPAGSLGVYLREFHPDHTFKDDAVIIHGIEKLDWGIGIENTFFGCLDRIEKTLGDGLPYNEMIGLSTYGFRTHFYPEFCPSSPDATVGFDTAGYLLDLMGYSYDVYALDNDTINKEDHPQFDYLNKDKLYNIIRQSIDDGWPVIATDMIEVAEWGIVTGYQADGNELICRTYFDKTRGYEIATKVPWLIYVIRDKVATDLTQGYKDCLSKASTINSQKMFDEYYSGFEAFKRWANDLENKDLYQGLSDKELQEKGHANWWIYSTILEARHILIDFLISYKDKIGFTKHDELIELYEKEYMLLDKHYRDFSEPQYGINGRVWDQATRNFQSTIITELEIIEKQILSLIIENI